MTYTVSRQPVDEQREIEFVDSQTRFSTGPGCYSQSNGWIISLGNLSFGDEEQL